MVVERAKPALGASSVFDAGRPIWLCLGGRNSGINGAVRGGGSFIVGVFSETSRSGSDWMQLTVSGAV